MGIWNVRDFGAGGKFDPTRPSTVDNGAILACIQWVTTNGYTGTIWFPSGLYQIVDGINQCLLAFTLAGATNAQFTLTIIAGTTGNKAQAYLTAPITFSGTNGNPMASTIQTAIRALATQGPVVISAFANVNVSWVGAPSNWYTVTFPASIGAPVMSGGGTNVTIVVSTLQSGAGLLLQNLNGIRLAGEAGAYADYDLPGPVTSRSGLVYTGTSNGIMAQLLGCQDVTIENLAFIGSAQMNSVNQARTALLVSSPQGSGSPQASRLTCRSVALARCYSTVSPASAVPPVGTGGCVQLGMNPLDGGADTTVWQGCTLSQATAGLLVVNQGAVNHHFHGCSLDTLATGAWFQQGGNAQYDGLKARAVGTVLRIGTGAAGYAASMGGGGTNASTFLLRNARTDPAGGVNPILVDATYSAPGTQVAVEGWDDSSANPPGPPPLFAQAASNTSSTNSVSVTMPQTVIQGDTLIVFAGVAGGTQPSQTAISDTLGNTWTYISGSAVSAGASPNVSGAAWYCASAKSGVPTITFSAPVSNCGIVVHEYSGINGTTIVEAQAAAGGNNSSPSSGTVVPSTGGSGTTSYGDVLVAWTAQVGGTATYGAGSGFALRTSGAGPSPVGFASEDEFTVAPGPYGGTFTQGVSKPWVCVCLALKPATDQTPALLAGAGASLVLRDPTTNRQVLALEGAGNPPSAILPAALRLENPIANEQVLVAAMCQSLTANTKAEVIAERTSIHNVLRPDVSRIMGRPRFSPVNWLIQQQNPKYFYDLGDIGLVAPNLGWNVYYPGSPPRTDGQYVTPPNIVQNVQGLVATDAVGGFNTRGPGQTAGSGYVSLRNGMMGIGQTQGKGWTLFAVVKRNSAGGVNSHAIISNLGAFGGGGLQLWFDDNSSGMITFRTDNGSNQYNLASVTTTGANSFFYILIQIIPGSLSTAGIYLYLNGSQTYDKFQPVSGVYTYYVDNNTPPLIGAIPGTPPTIADLQITRLATFDYLLPLSAWTAIYNAGTQYQGR